MIFRTSVLSGTLLALVSLTSGVAAASTDTDQSVCGSATQIAASAGVTTYSVQCGPWSGHAFADDNGTYS